MNGLPSKDVPALVMTPDTNSDFVTQVERRALYFGPERAPLFGWLHMPRYKPAGQMGMVLCPPLGSDYDHTYPVLRHLANRLAFHGIPVLRFDYSGMGNSSGFDVDPDRVENWLGNIQEARTALSNIAGCTEVGLFGVRTGGLLAAKFSHDNVLPCLVLWGVPSRGRSYVRELRAIHLTSESSQNTLLDENSDLEAGGFIFTPHTMKDLSTINLDSIAPKTERILFAARDDLPGDHSAPKSWLNVEQCILSGFNGMLTPPHDSHYRIPFSSLDLLEQWIVKDAHNINSISPKHEGSTQHVSLSCTAYINGCTYSAKNSIRESIFHFGERLERFAITTEPCSDAQPKFPWVIISSSGADHTGGQVRLSVLLSRALAQAGFRSVRFDFPGTGDSLVSSPSLENKPYQKNNPAEISSLIDALEQSFGTGKFILMGLCAGAFESFHGGLQLKQQQIVECVLLNPLVFYWEEGMNIDDVDPTKKVNDKQHSIEQHNRWKYYIGQMSQLGSWKNLLTGKSNLKLLVHTVSYKGKSALNEYFQSWTGKSSTFDDDPLTHDVRTLVDSGRRLTFVFARADHGYGLLMSHAGAIIRYHLRKKRVKISFIDRSNHTFSGRASRLNLINSVTNHLIQTYDSK